MSIYYEIQRASRPTLGYRWVVIQSLTDAPVPSDREFTHWRRATYVATAKAARRLLRELQLNAGGHQVGLVTCLHCRQPGGFPCIEPDNDRRWTAEATYLCGDCAEKAGFCRGCGGFWAGCETFDFSPIKGHCSDCVDQIRNDAADEGDPEYFDPEVEFDQPEPVSWEPRDQEEEGRRAW